MAKKISTSVYLTEDQADRLRTMNARTKVPMAAIIREAIDSHLAKLEREIDIAERANQPWPRLFLGGK